MNTNEAYVLIKANDLERLLDDSELYLRLEQAGVDNWICFDDAYNEKHGYSDDMDYWQFCNLNLLDKCDIANIEIYELYG